jgi:hypothetical protein
MPPSRKPICWTGCSGINSSFFKVGYNPISTTSPLGEVFVLLCRVYTVLQRILFDFLHGCFGFVLPKEKVFCLHPCSIFWQGLVFFCSICFKLAFTNPPPPKTSNARFIILSINRHAHEKNSMLKHGAYAMLYCILGTAHRLRKGYRW